MNVFDRICALLAFALGIALIVSGIIGAFIGIGAWYRLPPILGILPAFAGWGIVRSVYFGWYSRSREKPKFKVPDAVEPKASESVSSSPFRA